MSRTPSWHTGISKIMKMKRPNPRSFSILIVNFYDLYLFAIQNSYYFIVFSKITYLLFWIKWTVDSIRSSTNIIEHNHDVQSFFYMCRSGFDFKNQFILALNDIFTHTVPRLYSDCIQTVFRLYQDQNAIFSNMHDPSLSP